MSHPLVSTARPVLPALIAAAVLATFLLAFSVVLLPARFTPGGWLTCDTPLHAAQHLAPTSGHGNLGFFWVCLEPGGGYHLYRPGPAAVVDWAVYFVIALGLFFLLFRRLQGKERQHRS